MCSKRCASGRGSIEVESLLAHECTESDTLRHRILPDLVLGPTITVAFTEFLGEALGFVGLDPRAPLVVDGDLFAQAPLVVAVVMNGDVEPEPGAHHAREGW